MTCDKLSINEESIELLLSLERDHTLDRISHSAAPLSFMDYLLELGAVSLSEGGHAKWSRMLRTRNQLRRFDTDPLALFDTYKRLVRKSRPVG
ncbi:MULTISPECIES: hypothetical protein [Pseudomonas]|uniref:Uncharacterized protein n=2 Tax=Pseudomonas TaxID=286 RepID=A0A2X2CC92_PSELU|nr:MULTISPECIES: hypothetical protein [Pseudomonas]SER42080.1 hypothetical protein SAMN05216409_12026 [Pseudomonas lutea]SPZ05138.1 Uncharacterised protein [Pseudomonas luteola]